VIDCYDCQGNGYTVFLGKESDCKVCENGKLTICNNFTLAPDAVVVFRNQKCYHCGVKQNDHFKVKV
jgi:hypothetical protein